MGEWVALPEAVHFSRKGLACHHPSEKLPMAISSSMLGHKTNSYGWEVGMNNEPKPRDDSAQERARRLHEEEKPQTWKHPDDGTELSERDQERPLKP